jgi:hypothetical protein
MFNAFIVRCIRRELMMEDYRKSDRCIVDSDELAAQLWERIQPFAPAVYRSRRAVGINERFRFLRYNPGDFFDRHRDGTYVRGLEKGPEHEGEVSMITVQIYLNGVAGGGATTVYNSVDQDKALRVGKLLYLVMVDDMSSYNRDIVVIIIFHQFQNPDPSSYSSTMSFMTENW